MLKLALILALSWPWVLVLAVIAGLALGFVGAPAWAWVAALLGGLWWIGTPTWLLVLLAVPALLAVVPLLRSRILSQPIMQALRRLEFLPSISATEREALEAGTVWMDGELFSGKPDLQRAMAEDYPGLSPAEQAFLDGPVTELCRMTTDWEVQQRRDLPPAVWDFIKQNRLFGLIVPREFGGHGFSASANSAIVGKLASVSIPLGITVMVPNSLGPAELLIEYGTDQQRQYWLPKLARGEVVPAFALTEPNAGSDAAAIESSGVVFTAADGSPKLRLNWRKRYITLAAIADVLGLAFQLRDPDNLLGKGEAPGITCALVPTDVDGVVLGRRHDPLGVPFYNCPTEGHDVVVPVDAIIGGAAGAGRGWQMLMECLAAGRGISLPATSAFGIKRVARIAGAYTAVRQQFGLPIGKFEGVAEVLARIGGLAYLVEAARRYTCGGLDEGAKPAVVTAIMKYHTTELCRQVVNDGMDLLGGAGISMGPRNMLASGYAAQPISITVEGANILTRTLMIFGQGAIRCHPWARAEIDALAAGDVRAFDRALWGHVGHVVRNGCRALLLSISRGRLAAVPISGPAAPYLRKVAWASASFAFLADLAMTTLGGELKRREQLAGRFSDVLSYLYLATATIRRFEAEGRREEDVPFLQWSLDFAFARIAAAFDGLYRNLPIPGFGWLLAGPVAWWARLNAVGRGPLDRTGLEVARRLQVMGPQRDAITAGIFVPAEGSPGLGVLERALRLRAAAEPSFDRLKAAVRSGRLPRGDALELLDAALAEHVITQTEADAIRAAEAARNDAVQVDAFTLEEYLRSAVVDDAALGGTAVGERRG